MTFLLFIFSQLTYKRFLLFWAFAGMLITHSWFTEPWNPEIWHLFTRIGLYSCGSLAVFCFITSVILNKFNTDFKFSLYEVGMILYLMMAIISSLINTLTIGIYPIIQLAVPIVLSLSFIYLFSEQDVKKILIAITIFGLLNLLFSFAVFLLEKSGHETIFQIAGFITDRNGCAKYLSLINSFIFIEFILQKNMYKRFFLGFLLVLFFFGILILFSRSGYIVYFMSTLIILLMSNSKSIKRVAIVLMPVLLIIFSVFTLSRMHAEKMMVANASDLGRIYVGKAGINMIKAHPIKGIGYRMSELQIPKYADRKLPGLPNLVTIHNWFICVWAEMGFIGFSIFLIFNVTLLYNCFKRVQKVGFVDGKYALFSLAALAIFMFDAQVLPNYDYESIYWIVVAICIVSLKKNVKQTIFLKTAQ